MLYLVTGVAVYVCLLVHRT